ncbi:MAG TPA: Na+/H+ antiporter NhaC family protein [Wenzhouxiangellaceae bacterium]|nr:Na+/H+ antiporter NhaC family protein [Wenzhouxiangellaceae bacterium]
MKYWIFIRSFLLLLALLCGPALAQDESAATSYGWISILPPLIAIGLALILRQVIPALFAGIWIGAWAIAGFSVLGALEALMTTADTFILEAIAEPDHASVVLFTILVGGMVGVISRNGGMMGIVDRIITYANTVGRAMAATVAMGLAIFFDDYANTLVVGNTMRPITDRLGISREKLAYLVDSTAAPVATIALVTTWVGYEVGLIRDAIAGIPGLDLNAYMVFLNSIAYSFYPLLAITMVFAVVGLGRDFGPMHAAEMRARHDGRTAPPSSVANRTADEMADVQPAEGVRCRARNAVLPILTMVIGVVAGMFITGEGETLRAIVGSADPYKSLIWGSLFGSLLAIAMSIGQRVLTLGESVEAWFSGARAMLYAIFILVLAWALSGVTDVLGTADYLVSLVGDRLHPGLLPALVFVVAAATAFSTGSSWGTMGILLPLMVPLAWALMAASGMNGAEHLPILYATVAAVMGGAVWGDHCSPISDTTILSSMASQCDHIEHVRTQLPYALSAGVIAIVFGALPAGFGVPWWVCLPVGLLTVVVLVRLVGKKV